MLLLNRIIKLPILMLLAASMLSGNAMAIEPKTIYGYVEKATLVDKGLILSAKLDTGAKSSSLSAINVEPFEKNGLPYLRFVVPSKSGDVLVEAEYIGKVKIKVREDENRMETKIKPIRRPIVKVRVQVGNEIRWISVNLTNRKRFLYPLLLGRDAIKTFNGMVDPALVFTLKIREEVSKNEVK